MAKIKGHGVVVINFYFYFEEYFNSLKIGCHQKLLLKKYPLYKNTQNIILRQKIRRIKTLRERQLKLRIEYLNAIT
jgi:hypothetical protein